MSEESISIRQAKTEDIPKIMEFINTYWRKDDLLAKNRSFFEWSFVRDGNVTIIIGIDDSSDRICGMLAYMPYTLDEGSDCYMSIWKVIRNANIFLGQDLRKFFDENFSYRYTGGAGLRDRAIRLKKIQGKKVIRMDHFYRLCDCEEYKIADVKNAFIPVAPVSKAQLVKISNIEDFKAVISESVLENSVFRKNYWYIKHRYFDHSQYDYELWGIIDSDKKPGSNAVVITREEKYQDSRSWKLIDFYGDDGKIRDIAAQLDGVMKERGYEFIDVYSYGIPESLFLEGGFLLCDDNSDNIIPNYFHPFERRNVDIYMGEPAFEGLKLFRGDGDQDRPCEE